MVIFYLCIQLHFRKLDSVYHDDLSFVCGVQSGTHHCILCKSLAWSSLHHRRKLHKLLFIAKALLGKLDTYISNLLTSYTNSYCTRSATQTRLKVPRVYLFFSCHAPWVWDKLQNVLSLVKLPALSTVKCLLQTVLKETCKCFS